jgi:hypothetical protein
MKQTPEKRESYLAKKRAALDQVALELSSMSLFDHQ